ncbi:hypothetical protein ACLOJK_027687 [Asimina triloba]
MPELPEVEAARRAIEEHCVGKKIKHAVVADDPKVIDAVSPSDFQASLAGKSILAARRKGKNMWLLLDSPPFPSFQFEGYYRSRLRKMVPFTLRESTVKDSDEWPSKYSKLDDGLEFSFTDKRRFAKVRLLGDPETVPPISELGPDALLEPMPLDEFVESLSKKKIAIKALLLDQIFLVQNFIAGIGNWIADEVLYQILKTISSEFVTCLPDAEIGLCGQNNGNEILIEMGHGKAQEDIDGGMDFIKLNSVIRDTHESIPYKLLQACPKSKWQLCINASKRHKKMFVIEKALDVGTDSCQYPDNWIFHSREKKPGKAFVDGSAPDFQCLPKGHLCFLN